MKEINKPGYYPILVNLDLNPCLIIGGGNIALQKVKSLLKFNSDITVISPEFCDQLQIYANEAKIKIIRKFYSKEDLDNFKIVFSATNLPDLNKQVYNDCKDKDILLNVVDVPELCDFILPANIIRGNLSVSISSQGKAPFYSKEFKRKLNDVIPPVYEEVLDLAAEFRRVLLEKHENKPWESKKELFQKFNSIDWEMIITKKGVQEARIELNKLLKEL